MDIVAENPDKFRVVALAAGSNVTLLADQVSIHIFLQLCLSMYFNIAFISGEAI